MSHSAEINQKGGPLASDGFVDYVKKVQNERGDPFFGDKKISEKKVAQCRKKSKKSKGGTL